MSINLIKYGSLLFIMRIYVFLQNIKKQYVFYNCFFKICPINNELEITFQNISDLQNFCELLKITPTPPPGFEPDHKEGRAAVWPFGKRIGKKKKKNSLLQPFKHGVFDQNNLSDQNFFRFIPIYKVLPDPTPSQKKMVT